MNFHSFKDRDTLCVELEKTLTSLLSEGINSRGRASLAVSGGSTPVQLFKSLSSIDIDWQQVDICLVDERWVEPSDPDSNENLVRTHLLQNKAAAAQFIGMKNSATTAGEGEADCAAHLAKLQRPFDVLILGMGNDGHTASLFPGAVKLPQATDMDSGKICMGIAPVTAPHERMTLTLPEILASRQLFLHITGQDKKEVLEQAMQPGAVEEMPIRYVLQQADKESKENTKNIKKIKNTKKIKIYWAK